MASKCLMQPYKYLTPEMKAIILHFDGPSLPDWCIDPPWLSELKRKFHDVPSLMTLRGDNSTSGSSHAPLVLLGGVLWPWMGPSAWVHPSFPFSTSSASFSRLWFVPGSEHAAYMRICMQGSQHGLAIVLRAFSIKPCHEWSTVYVFIFYYYMKYLRLSPLRSLQPSSFFKPWMYSLLSLYTVFEWLMRNKPRSYI